MDLALRRNNGTDFSIWTLVLGLNDAASARKLVRLLLADPLSPRETWEDILDSYDADSSRGLLIRYERVCYLRVEPP
jgi:hypothetical protein